MPTQYISTREKAKIFFEKQLLPQILRKDADYNKVLKTLSREVGCSINLAEEIVQTYIDIDEITEERYLRASDSVIKKMLQSREEAEKEAEEVLGDAK